jgi:enoyl-CoA hydratase
MAYKNIVVEKKDGIGKITINRPKVLNALNQETVEELTKAVKELEKDSKMKVIILTGEG